jgi:hypothetical protein
MSEKPNAHKVISASTIPVYVAEIETASAPATPDSTMM